MYRISGTIIFEPLNCDFFFYNLIFLGGLVARKFLGTKTHEFFGTEDLGSYRTRLMDVGHVRNFLLTVVKCD